MRLSPVLTPRFASYWFARLVIGVLLTTTALAAEDPKLKATLISEHASLAPNSKSTLAVKLEIPDQWHIYHPIVLDTGLSTDLSLTLPAGITAGPVRYPSPVFLQLDIGSDSNTEQTSQADTQADSSVKGKVTIEFEASKDAVTLKSKTEMTPDVASSDAPATSEHQAIPEQQSETIDYLAYEGEAVLLVELTGDTSLKPGTKATIDASINALICEHNGKCIPVEASATLALPITAKLGAKQQSELFEEARSALPAPLAEAPYLKGSTLTFQHSQLPIGVDSELILTLNIGKGYHIQDRDPGVDGLIPTRVWIESIDGITFETKKQTWPKPKTEQIEYLGTVRQQSGQTVIRTPFKVTDKLFKPQKVTLHVLVEYQTCTEAGQCFPPTQAIGAVQFEVVPADAQAKQWQKPSQPTKPGWAAYVTTTESEDSVTSDTQTAQTASTDSNASAAAVSSAANANSGDQSTGLLALLLTLGGAFLGGVILNIMPCVLPVVSLKIFGFVNQAGEDHSRIFKMGLVYAAGVLVSFLPLAIAIALFNQAWGGVIFQSPVALMLLSGFMLTFGLSMVGLYEIQLPGSASSVASGAMQREGYGGAFMSGLVTTALATPCTGPFLGPALGALSTQPASIAFVGIMLVGAGLAFPYVLLSAVPGWLKYLPKPGNWMVTFKQVTGLIILAVPLWLLWNLSKYQDAALLFGAVVFLFGVGVASFVVSKIDLNASTGKTVRLLGTAAALVLAGWYVGPGYFGIASDSDRPAPVIANAPANNEPANIDIDELYASADAPHLPWQAWQPGLPEKLAQSGYTVYVDFTAAWCLTCQTNKATVLHTSEIDDLFRELKVVPLKGDFTRRNPAIKTELRKFKRNGVPLNLIYPAGKPENVIVMPELLTQSMVTERLKQAGPSTAKTGDDGAGKTVAAR